MWRERVRPALRAAWRAEDFKSLWRYRVVPVRRSSSAASVWGGIVNRIIVRTNRRIKNKFVGWVSRAHFCARIHARENEPHPPSLREKSRFGIGGIAGAQPIGVGGAVAGARSGERASEPQ